MSLLQRIIFTFTALIVWSGFAHAVEFGVSPMMINLAGAPNDSEKFQVQIAGKSDGKVKVSVYRLSQLPTGHMNFMAPDPKLDNMSNWMTLDQNMIAIRKDEVSTVNGQIKIPRDANGNYVAAVMVEEGDPLKKKAGVQFDVRYAVIVSLGVNGVSHTRTITEFKDVSLHTEKDRVFVQGSFTNGGKTDGTLDSELQLRDANNRLIQKVTLKTQSAWERGDAGSRVFPGSDVLVFGELPRTLPAGTYQVVVHDRFGDHAQPMYKGDLTLPADLFAAAKPDAPAAGATSGRPVLQAMATPTTTDASSDAPTATQAVTDQPDTF